MEKLNIKQKANLEAAKRLVRQYRAITLKTLKYYKETIKYHYRQTEGIDILETITGFGSPYSCKLCESVRYYKWGPQDCKCRIWVQTEPVYSFIVSKYPCMNSSFYEISHAIDLETLLTLIRDRANLIENIIKIMEN